jgi:hypothetical protein
MIVMMMAMTPSLNARSRSFFMALSLPLFPRPDSGKM